MFFFGCGFGARNFVEFSVFLAFPIADFFNSQLNRSLRIGIGVLIFFCVCFNLKMMAAWDVCFWGTNDWGGGFEEHYGLITLEYVIIIIFFIWELWHRSSRQMGH